MEDILNFEPAIDSGIDLNNALRRRTIHLCSEINESLIDRATYLLDRIMFLDKRLGTKEPITLKIRTYGGSGMDGFALVGKIVYMKSIGYTIIADTEGYAMSMGSYIVAVCSYRTCGMYDKIMIHNISSGFEGSMSALKNRLEELNKMQAMADGVIIEYTRITQKMLDKNKDIDWYISAKEAKALGLIDEIKGV